MNKLQCLVSFPFYHSPLCMYLKNYLFQKPRILTLFYVQYVTKELSLIHMSCLYQDVLGPRA